MFDANLCGAEEGANIYVEFWGKSSKNGIIAGTYRCRVVNRTGIDEEMTIAVFNPCFRKRGMKRIIYVRNEEVGTRWVTFDSRVES